MKFTEEQKREKEKARQRAVKARWRAAHPEIERQRQKAARKKRHATNPEKVRLTSFINNKKFYAKDPEFAREYHRLASKKWRDKDVQFANAYQRAWKKEWRLRFPEKAKAEDRARMLRRVRKRRSLLAHLRKLQSNRCAICHHNLPQKAVHVDHILPRKLGGTNARSNLQLTCASCNLRKGARHPAEHAHSRGLLL